MWSRRRSTEEELLKIAVLQSSLLFKNVKWIQIGRLYDAIDHHFITGSLFSWRQHPKLVFIFSTWHRKVSIVYRRWLEGGICGPRRSVLFNSPNFFNKQLPLENYFKRLPSPPSSASPPVYQHSLSLGLSSFPVWTIMPKTNKPQSCFARGRCCLRHRAVPCHGKRRTHRRGACRGVVVVAMVAWNAIDTVIHKAGAWEKPNKQNNHSERLNY